jgi:DNA-3-methyladenine glycosylase I
MSNDAVAGLDGLLRCPWALSRPELTDYHDREWGRPVRSVSGLFERLTLEAFQSGLSWLTILRKREHFRNAFAGFDPERVAAFGPAEVDRLLGDAGIVRNRAKIEAAIHNAGVVAAMDDDFVELVWSFADPERPRPRLADWRATSPESVALARALKRRGIRFFGPTTAYALMQAAGLVDDHLADCQVPPAPAVSAMHPNRRGP